MKKNPITKSASHFSLFTLSLLTFLALASCESAYDPAASPSAAPVTFTVEGDFSSPTFTRAENAQPSTLSSQRSSTRAALTGEGGTMTDLYILDYMSGVLVQQLHQTADDADFGTPTLPLAIGDHDLYFVCARGASPVLSTDEHTVTWVTPRDTFWKHLAKSVTSNAAATQTVALDRVATRLAVTLVDAIADGTAAIEICPDTWYYGIDYLTGDATAPSEGEAVRITIPASYVGRTGVNLSIFGIGRTSEFTTDVTLAALDADDDILASAAIAAAPMQQNRSTNYSGRLFSGNTSFTLSLNTEWDTPYTGEWE